MSELDLVVGQLYKWGRHPKIYMYLGRVVGTAIMHGGRKDPVFYKFLTPNGRVMRIEYNVIGMRHVLEKATL